MNKCLIHLGLSNDCLSCISEGTCSSCKTNVSPNDTMHYCTIGMESPNNIRGYCSSKINYYLLSTNIGIAGENGMTYIARGFVCEPKISYNTVIGITIGVMVITIILLIRYLIRRLRYYKLFDITNWFFRKSKYVEMDGSKTGIQIGPPTNKQPNLSTIEETA